MRLDKYLCDAGLGTRSQVKKLIKDRQISVNGIPATDAASAVLDADVILYKGKQVVLLKGERTYLFHKPAGCVTANEDNLHKTVLDYFPAELKKGLNPVGRLDLDTEGLLLLTTDGKLLHHLISPRHEVPKTYYARLDQPVPEDAVFAFSAGIDIGDDKPTLPAKLTILNEETPSAELTITEGRFHQVKRMFAAVGCEVIYLKRISEGTLTLGQLEPGQFRKLTEEELASLTKA